MARVKVNFEEMSYRIGEYQYMQFISHTLMPMR